MALRAPGRHAARVDYEGPNPRKRLYIFLAILAVLLAAGAFLARPAYHGYKHWRALQLAQAAELALQARDLETAMNQAGSAMQLWQDDVRVVRAEAKVLEIASPPTALSYWQRVWSMSGDLADLRHLLELALALGDLSFASNQFADLQKAEPDKPATWLLEGRILLASNRIPEALADFKKVLASGQAPPEAHLYFANAAAESDDMAERAAGLEHLQALSVRADALGLQTLRALANYPGQPLDNIPALADKLQKHPLATREDKLLALQLRSFLPGADMDTLIQAARDLFPASDVNALAEVGAWLINQNQNEAVLKLIDPASAMKRKDLFLIRAGAMAALGQWAELDQLL